MAERVHKKLLETVIISNNDGIGIIPINYTDYTELNDQLKKLKLRQLRINSNKDEYNILTF